MKQASKNIFIGGIHGVGKSFLCQQYSAETEIGHYVASTLIKSVRDADNGLHKEVLDANKNQDALLRAIKLNVTHKYFLLDGHFIIRTINDSISIIPISVFEAISPIGIVIVTGDPVTAAARMKARDGHTVASDILHTMQIEEIRQGQLVSQKLNIPFFTIPNSEPHSFKETIHKLWQTNISD